MRQAQMLAVLAALSVFTTAAIGQTTQTQNSGEKIKIGFSLEAEKGERWQTDVAAFEARAKELGATAISADAESDDDLQLQQVRDMIKAGIKVLVVLPRDTKQAGRLVEAAKAANVKVISYDRLILDSDVDLYISFDPREIGRLQAEYLVKLAPKGNYILVGGSPNDDNAKILHGAQVKVLQPYLDRGDIKLVADWYTKEWQPSEAYLHMLEALDSSKKNITAILASNDGMAGGAIQALQDNKLEGKVLVTGQDADLAAIRRILDGTQSMTIYKPVVNQAARAAEEAVRMAKGEPVAENQTVNNGKKNVPTIMLTPVVVTKDNIKTTVIKDGFQKLDAINHGLPKDKQIPN